jgi:hypothetical protein
MIRDKHLIASTIVALAVVLTACDSRPSSSPTGPTISATNGSASLSSSPRSGALHVTKECSQFTHLAGGFCTITSSNIKEIEVGSKVVYASAAGATSLDSDLSLDLPGLGNNAASGHVALNFLTLTGIVTFSGGTGKFTHFNAAVAVTHLTGPNWAWDGTYSFTPQN